MKNILYLTRKLVGENRLTLLLYTVLLFGVMLLFAYGEVNDAMNNYEFSPKHQVEGVSYLQMTYERLNQSVFIVLMFISISSLTLSIHWSLRHFISSGQSYHYGTLPLSIAEKMGFTVLFTMFVIPFMHFLLMLSATYLAYAFRVPGDSGFPLGTTFARDVFLGSDGISFISFLLQMIFGISMFILISSFFKRLGFIKVIAVFIVLLIGIALFIELMNLNIMMIAKTILVRDAPYFSVHLTVIFFLSLCSLFVIQLRLRDKNY